MKIITERIECKTKGDPDLVNITDRLRAVLEKSGLQEGSLTAFVVGSTAAITTFEFEPGLKEDMEEFFERLAPRRQRYHHDATWGDANGFSHVRAAITGPSLTVPFVGAELALGTWQQVVLAEFDNRPRTRTIIVQLTGA